MKRILVILGVFLSLNILSAQDCAPMPNGIYIAQYDGPFKEFPLTKFIIKGDKLIYIDLETKERTERKITGNKDCYLAMEKTPIEESESRSEIQKLLNSQNPYFEIEQIRNGVYRFKQRVNQHVVISQGKFFLLQ